MMIKSIRFFVTVFILFCITGCGWHLRGNQNFPENMRVMAVDPDDPYDPFQKSLRSLLTASGVVFQKDAPVLHLAETSFSKQDLTIDAKGEVSEQLIIFTVVFSMDAPDGKELMPQQTVHIEHKIAHNESQLLRQEAEERTLHQIMQDDAANQIVHRMLIQLKAKPA
jgi:LPS-assembly lipoprotein